MTGNPQGKDELVEVVMQGQLHYLPRHIVTEISKPEHFSDQLLWGAAEPLRRMLRILLGA